MYHLVERALILGGILACLAFSALAQSSATSHPAASDAVIANASMPIQMLRADEERRKLRVEIERLRATVTEQLQLIDELQERIEQTAQSAASPSAVDIKPATSETLARVTTQPLCELERMGREGSPRRRRGPGPLGGERV